MKRRMFSDDVVSSGKFLRLSMTAQALYFHLGMNADDDGVVEAFTVMRMVGAKEDDLVLLSEREFVTVLDEKELVLWMTGWQDFNKIDPRIKEDSKYLPLLLAKVDGIETVASTKTEANRRRYQRLKVERSLKKNDPRGINAGSSGDIRDDLHVIHAVSIDKYSTDKSSTNPPLSPQEVFVDAWKNIVGTVLRNNLDDQEAAAQRLRDALGANRVKEMLMAVRILRADTHAPRKLQVGITNYVSMEFHLEALEAYAASKLDQKATSSVIYDAS